MVCAAFNAAGGTKCAAFGAQSAAMYAAGPGRGTGGTNRAECAAGAAFGAQSEALCAVGAVFGAVEGAGRAVIGAGAP